MQRLILSPAGGLQLPKEVQEQLNLHAGIPFLVQLEANQLCLQPMNSAYLKSLRGSLKDEAFNLPMLHEEKATEQALEEAKLKRFRLHRR